MQRSMHNNIPVLYDFVLVKIHPHVKNYRSFRCKSIHNISARISPPLKEYMSAMLKHDTRTARNMVTNPGANYNKKNYPPAERKVKMQNCWHIMLLLLWARDCLFCLVKRLLFEVFGAVKLVLNFLLPLLPYDPTALSRLLRDLGIFSLLLPNSFCSEFKSAIFRLFNVFKAHIALCTQAVSVLNRLRLFREWPYWK